MGEYITTFSKIHFTPTEPVAADIKIKDVAHALSLLCRANGHFRSFFSVAQHSINCAMEARERGCSPRIQLACLLHDASEAYISDVTRPIKKLLPDYREFEDRLQNTIWNKYLEQQLNNDEVAQVFQIDDAMLYYEFLYFMEEQIFEQKPDIKSNPDFEFRGFERTEKQFVSLFNKLKGKKTGTVSVGVDGCKGEWIAVSLSDEIFEVGKYKTINEICEKYYTADAMLIDVPIGLPESRNEAIKRPDNELRSKLSKKSSSVFNTPFRQIVNAPDTKSAWELNNELDARQNPISMALCNGIKHVDDFLQNNYEWKNRLLESHPEYCFYLLNGEIPLDDSKLNENGIEARIKILKAYFPNVREVIDTYLKQNKFRKKIDDVVDALCLAVVGQLGLEQGFKTIPDIPFKDRTGLNMQITVINK
ncbi:MAG: DUF429 domain-containing protein [Clostridia bacterium]|nr:DUF429 domain-containing protein [Clostridia bacterium]